jgi:O-acetylhomoserine (thiol)-lyase
MSDEQAFRTKSVHAGQAPEGTDGAAAPPIHQTTSYVFEDAETTAAMYALDREGHIYSRISNPTVQRLETQLSELAGGTGAVATGSGMAALDALTMVLAKAGENIVCSTDTYGGTTAYLSHTASRRGIETRFVPTLEPEAYEEAIDENTAYVHVETIGNPSLVTPDFEQLTKIAHAHDLPLVVDNTFATPALCRPLEHGADVVWHSTTKWLHGSGTTVGGVVIDGGDFDWAAGEYEEIAGENPAYDGVDFSRDFPEAPLAAAVRHRAVRSLGNQQTPFDAWQTMQGIQTLPLRVERHGENAAIVAEHLAEHEEVAWVTYPGRESHPTHDNASRYLDGGYGGMVTFGLEDGYEAGQRFCEATDLARFLANVGDAKTLVIHPASTTHAQLSPDEQREAGVTPDLIRLSVGIEDPADILADIETGIEAATEDDE